MAVNFNKRIFGSQMNPQIENKLRARQALAESSNPNESIDFKEIDGQTVDIKGAIKTHNFDSAYNDSNSFVADLSSRTPWARAWVAVEIFKHRPEITSKTVELNPAHYEEYGSDIANSRNGIPKTRFVGDKYRTVTDITQTEKTEILEKKVYVLGDNNYDLFNGQLNVYAPIEGQQSVSDIGASTSDIFKNELENNSLLKPHAGITSVTSKTDGPFGAIKYTTVNFVVHNFDDFQNIYSKFFLKPGATVFVDFGWDTAKIYNPQDLISQNLDPIKEIYGSTEKPGYIDEAAGDLDVVIGKVTEFNSVVDINGSFICDMTIVSDNAALLDYEISDENKLRSKMVDNLSVVLINKLAERLGTGFIKNDWTSDNISAEESKNYANSFANKLVGSGKKSTVITEDALKLGMYWQSLGSEKETLKETGWFDLELDKEADVAISDDDNLYISWAFFEEEILNKELGFIVDKSDFGGHFDSTDSFISYEPNLIERQNISYLYSKKKTGFKFLYPPSWKEGTTYDTIVNSKSKNRYRPDFTQAQELFGSSLSSEFDTFSSDVAANRIPLRELFINVSVISDAFSSNNSVSEALIAILNTINGDSAGVFKLKLISGTKDNSTMTIIDTNFYNSTYDEIGDKFNNLFEFNPYTKGSIVKDMSLSFQTPNNDMQTMLAIQNKSANIPLFPSTERENQNQAMRIIYNLMDKENTQIGIRHLPSLNTNSKNSNENTEKIEVNRMEDANILEGDGSADEIINQYKEISAAALEYTTGEGEEIFKAMTKEVTDSENEETDNDVEGSDDPEDILEPDAVYAKSIEEYYDYNIKKNFTNIKRSIPIPITVSLTTYGIANISPGDIFNVNYLPSQYKNRIYFQVVGVENRIETTGWETVIETKMQVRQDALVRPMYKTMKNIYISRTWLESIRLNPLILSSFKNFKLSPLTDSGVLVFNVHGRKQQKFDPKKTFNKYDSWDNFAKNFYEEIDGRGIEVKHDKEYIIAIVVGGAFAWESGSVNNMEGKIKIMKDRLSDFITSQSYKGGYGEDAGSIASES